MVKKIGNVAKTTNFRLKKTHLFLAAAVAVDHVDDYTSFGIVCSLLLYCSLIIGDAESSSTTLSSQHLVSTDDTCT